MLLYRLSRRPKRKRRPDVSTDAIEKYLHDLYAAHPDFLHSVSREFIRNCQTPILVLPDDVLSHPLQTSIDYGFSSTQCRDNPVPLERPAGAECPDDQPGAEFPAGASTEPRRIAGCTWLIG